MGAPLCILFVRGLFLAAIPVRPTRRLIVTIHRLQSEYQNAKTTQRQYLFALPTHTHSHSYIQLSVSLPVCHFLFFHSIRFQAIGMCVCVCETDLNISFLSFIDAHVLSPSFLLPYSAAFFLSIWQLIVPIYKQLTLYVIRNCVKKYDSLWIYIFVDFHICFSKPFLLIRLFQECYVVFSSLFLTVLTRWVLSLCAPMPLIHTCREKMCIS